MDRPTALVIEDTPEFALLGQRLLESEGFRVITAATGERGLAQARKETPELVLLDISLPDLDGFEVCRRIREFSDCYVVMVTARHEEFDRVLGLSVGADDYVVKPFSNRELAARIKAMRRRPRAPAEPERRDFGDLVVDPVAREVTLHGRTLDLTKIEYGILDLLSASPRRTFERSQLMTHVWGADWHGDDHVIDVHLSNLRRKLGESASDQRYVRTVRGVGFRFEPSGGAAAGS